MIYAYSFTLCRRAVVIAMDMSAANLHLLDAVRWLSDPKNVLVVKLTAPAWNSGDVFPPAHLPASRDVMTAWSVRDVVAFLVGQDLEGPASVLQANGVSGADLVTMTAETMSRELRLSPFAARKVVSARDTYLQQA